MSDIQVTLGVDELYQDCLPVVPPDPVSFTGSLLVQNVGSTPVGPLTFSRGHFLDGSLIVLAAFEVDTTVAVVGPGASATAVVEKRRDSMVPGQGCELLACDSGLVVELPYAGPGVPSGAYVRSSRTDLACGY
jgi:hypothetical protein